MVPDSAPLLILVAAFFAAAGLVVGVLMLIRKPAVVQRLETVMGMPGTASHPASEPGDGEDRWTEVISRLAQPFARFTLPKEGWEESELRRRFIHAGWRNSSAPVIFFGVKTILGLGLPALYLMAKLRFGWDLPPMQTMLLAGWLLAVGFFLPNWLLNRQVKRRQLEIFEAFPDALDLLTICVEAGLGLDAALVRVAKEIRLETTELAEELELVTLEMRAGVGKDRALRNLALRTGVQDIESLVALLVQSERFGTSIGESLRVQSETLRVKRQQRAEEAAAKISVKLVFPLVLCILPSIFFVVGGPAVIQISKSFGALFGAK